LPANVNVTHLPDSITFNENGHSYRASYRLSNNDSDNNNGSDQNKSRDHNNQGQVVLLSRVLEIETPSDVCQPGDEAAYNKLLKVVQNDLRGQILYKPAQTAD